MNEKNRMKHSSGWRLMTINIEIVLLIQYIRKPSNPNNRLEKFYVCTDAIFHRSSHPIDGIPANTTMLSQR